MFTWRNETNISDCRLKQVPYFRLFCQISSTLLSANVPDKQLRNSFVFCNLLMKIKGEKNMFLKIQFSDKSIKNSFRSLDTRSKNGNTTK